MKISKIKVGLFLAFGVMIFSVAKADDFGRYDITQYGAKSTDFWEHAYYSNAACGSSGICTHTGNDYNLDGGINAGVPVPFYGFGRVSSLGDCGRLTLKNLLTSGESLSAIIFHLRQRDVEADDYIVPYQLIGKEGGECVGGNAYSHLHLEFVGSNQEISNWVGDDEACPGDGCLNNERNLNYRIDALDPYYVINSTQEPGIASNGRIWYSPDAIAIGSDETPSYGELLPYVSISANPSVDQYTVYGRSGASLYGSLTFNRVNSANFSKTGIFVRQGTDRENTVELAANLQWLFSNDNVDIGNTSLNGNNSGYTLGQTYLFYPWVQKTAGSSVEGYPVMVQFIGANDVIVDNDQLNTAPYEYSSTFSDDANSNNVPGYYLTAKLIQGTNSTSVKWKPGVNGRYRISVYVPGGATATNLQYSISSDGNAGNLVASNAINQSVNNNNWVQITDNNGVNLTVQGYVELNLASAFNAASITGDMWVGFDAVKFENIDGAGISDQNSGEQCPNFHDVTPQEWYWPYITRLATDGIINGYLDGNFRPNNQINRAEFLAILLKTAFPNFDFDSYQPQAPFFQDIPYDDDDDPDKIPWYLKKVYYARDQQIVKGYAEGTTCDGSNDPGRIYFCPANPINRAEASKMIVNTFGLEPYEVGDKNLFSDVVFGSDWFYSSVYACALREDESGELDPIVEGYPNGTFGPGQIITRAEAAKMICIAENGKAGCNATCQ